MPEPNPKNFAVLLTALLALAAAGVFWMRSPGRNVAPTPTAIAIPTPIVLQREGSDDIYEAVLRYMAQGSKASAKYHGHTVTRAETLAFVSIDGDDPSESFLRRFETDLPEILPASRGIANDYKGDIWQKRLIDKQSKRIGAPLEFHRIEWKNANSASVQVDVPGSGSRYFLQKQSENWVIAKKEMAWIR